MNEFILQFTYSSTFYSVKKRSVFPAIYTLLMAALVACSKETTTPEEPTAVVTNDPNVGCTDATAKNYKASAMVDDCSCEYNYTSKIATTTPATFLRRALIEEYTGTWCGWCPMGKEAMEDLTANPQVVGVEVHFNDEMAAIDNIYTPLKKQFGGVTFPSGMVNRRKSVLGGRVYMVPEDWKANVDEWLKQGSATVGIASETTLENRKLSLLTHLKFTQKTSERLRLAIYLVEDNVTGYAQLNYLSNYQQFKQYRAFAKPAEITDIKFYNVARASIVPITEGIEIPKAATENSKTYRKLFTVNLPSTVAVPANCKAVVFVMNEQFEILTAREVKMNARNDWE